MNIEKPLVIVSKTIFLLILLLSVERPHGVLNNVNVSIEYSQHQIVTRIMCMLPASLSSKSILPVVNKLSLLLTK